MAINDFPPVQYVSDLLPWESPTYIPPSPHNLPARPDPALGTTTRNSLGGDTANIREIYRYASVTSLSVTIGTTSVKFLDQPIGKRNFLGFRNASTGGQTLYIDFSANATTGSWLQIPPGTLVLFDTVVPQDDLYAIADAAGGQLAYAYSTFGG
ncbi:MAG: hypothetical protein EB060_11590 [Proteobacteria bacterium]|nr:hypothetical protein [Pseudomonadota bacterium]